MTFKFIRRYLTGTINRGGCEKGQFTGGNSTCTIIANTKLSAKKCLPNSSWCLYLLLLLYYTIYQILPKQLFSLL